MFLLYGIVFTPEDDVNEDDIFLNLYCAGM